MPHPESFSNFFNCFFNLPGLKVIKDFLNFTNELLLLNLNKRTSKMILTIIARQKSRYLCLFIVGSPSSEDLPRRKPRLPPAHAWPVHSVRGPEDNNNYNTRHYTDESGQERPSGDTLEFFAPPQKNPERDDPYRWDKK